MRKLSILIPTISLVFSASLGWAQVPLGLDPGQVLKQETERLQPAPKPKELPVIDVPESEKEAIDLESIRITVKSFNFQGASAISDEDLQLIVAPVVGTEVYFKELQALAKKIETEYRRRGYPLVRVVLPPQDVTEGDILIEIIEGRVEVGPSSMRVVPDGKFRVHPDIIRHTLESTLSRDVAITDAALERASLLVNDMAGVSASLGLEPGSEPGQARIVLKTREVPLFSGSLTADSAGNRLTGTDRYGANAYINSPFGAGELISLSAIKSFENRFEFHRIGYDMPIGPDGLWLNTAYTEARFSVGKELEEFKARGNAQNLSIGIRYPFIRSRTKNLYGSLGYELKKSESYSDVSFPLDVATKQSKKRSHVHSIGLSGDIMDGIGDGGYNKFSLFVHSGNIDLSTSIPFDPLDPTVLNERESDAQGLKIQGGFSKFNLNFARMQAFGNNNSALINLIYQRPIGSQNLDSSEKLSLGGVGGVRAYPSGEASSDQAFIMQLEFKSTLGRNILNIGDLSAFAFYDYGRGEINNDPRPNTLNQYSLEGAGLGFILAKEGRYEFRIFGADPLGNNPAETPDGNDSDGKAGTRIIANLTVPF